MTPVDDAVVEGDETIVVPGSTTDEVGLTVTSASITLTDDNKTTTTPTDDVDSAELSIADRRRTWLRGVMRSSR